MRTIIEFLIYIMAGYGTASGIKDIYRLFKKDKKEPTNGND